MFFLSSGRFLSLPISFSLSVVFRFLPRHLSVSKKSAHRSGFLLSFSDSLNRLALCEVYDLSFFSFARNGSDSNEDAILPVKEVFYIDFNFTLYIHGRKKIHLAWKLNTWIGRGDRRQEMWGGKDVEKVTSPTQNCRLFIPPFSVIRWGGIVPYFCHVEINVSSL